MRHRSIPILAGLVLIVWPPGGGALAKEPPAAEVILERAEEVRSPDLDYAVDFTLEVSDPNSAWKQRTSRYTLIANGKNHSLILLREPQQFHPGTLLIQNGLYWMLFPRTDKPIQLSARNVLSGDVANGDLARGNLLNHYSVSLDGEETVEGDGCWILEMGRISNVALYPRIRYAVARKKERPIRLEYFGETGRLDRRVWYRDYTKTPLGQRAMRIVVESGKRAGEVSTMVFSDLRRIDLTGLEFDVPGLIAFRDAALKRYQDAGEQARPEDVIPMIGAAAR